MKKNILISTIFGILLFMSPSYCLAMNQDRFIDGITVSCEVLAALAEGASIYTLGSESTSKTRITSSCSAAVYIAQVGAWIYCMSKSDDTNKVDNIIRVIALFATNPYLFFREIARCLRAKKLAGIAFNPEKLKKIKRRLYIKLGLTTLLSIPYYVIPHEFANKSWQDRLLTGSGVAADLLKALYKHERQSYEIDLSRMIEDTNQKQDTEEHDQNDDQIIAAEQSNAALE